MSILNINKNIVFEPKEHSYHDLNGKKYTSTTQLISIYKNPFDPNGHISRACAKKEGISVKEIQDKWQKIGKDATDRGHNVHSQLEYYIKNKEILDADYKDVVQEFAKIKFSGKLYSEIGVHHPEYLISGTIDLIELFDDNTCNLLDFKSNRKIDLKSKYGNKLLHPLEKYDECEINIYAIQLGIYKYILEYHGYKVKKITLLWINPETRLIEHFKIPDIKEDIVNLLEYHKKMLSW